MSSLFPGLDGNFVSPATFPVACGFGTWMLTLGFTLAYGAMFSKIWRVHRLKDKSESKKVSVSNHYVYLITSSKSRICILSSMNYQIHVIFP